MTEIPAAVAHRIRAALGFIFDMDGTLALGDAQSGGYRALPGAIALLATLRQRGIPFRVFTNGTAKPPAAYASSLRSAGFELEDGEMMTPATSAARWFVSRRIRRVRVLGTSGVGLPFAEAGIEVIGPSDRAAGVEAVFTAWFPTFSLVDLEAACHDVWNGAMLTTASNVPFFATSGGKAIGVSFALNAMIRAMTRQSARVLGKPSATAFQVAVKHMGLTRADASRIVVVGDDPGLEMRMARRAGALAVGMTTGLMNIGNTGLLPPEERPDVLLDDLSALSSFIVSAPGRKVD